MRTRRTTATFTLFFTARIRWIRRWRAIARGPIVYCLESVDLPKGVGVMDVHLTSSASFQPATDARLPHVAMLEGEVQAISKKKWDGQLYRDVSRDPLQKLTVRLVPYF